MGVEYRGVCLHTGAMVFNSLEKPTVLGLFGSLVFLKVHLELSLVLFIIVQFKMLQHNGNKKVQQHVYSKAK